MQTIGSEVIASIANLIGWIGAGGLLAYGLIIFLAPHLLPVLSGWLKALTPLVEGLSKGLVVFFHMLWDGIKDILDNVNTILTVVLIVIVALLYGRIEYGSRCVADCKQCIDNLRPDYKFVKRTSAEKERYLRATKKQADSWKNWIPWS